MTRSPTEIDEHVGVRLRERRKILGMSQSVLAQKLGVSFQQVQKYERGVNRIGAGRLYEISKVLGVAINYFFDGIDELPMVAENDNISQPDLSLAVEVSKIRDPRLRDELGRLVRLINEAGVVEATPEAV